MILKLYSRIDTIVLIIDYNTMDILKLKKSKTRRKILQLFFSDLNKKYYLRELERILNLPVGNIRRELLGLEKAGIFKREKIGNQIYYSVNRQSPIFEEFKKIVSKTIGVEASLQKALKKIKNIKVAFIFGSYAKGKEDSLSDIDLMIVGTPDEDLLVSKIAKLEKQLNREINYHIFSEKDWKKKIKEKDPFLENILSQPKIFLIGKNAELDKLLCEKSKR
jgi:predicted nucleotidyltransferase